MAFPAQFVIRSSTIFFPGVSRKIIPSYCNHNRSRSSFLLRCCSYSSDDAIKKKNYLELTEDELMRECEMNTFKASGPGGQHRNKRESAVRIKHLPTGVVAQAVEDRSQHKNRASAVARLRTLLALKGFLIFSIFCNLSL